METVLLVNALLALLGAYFVSKGKSIGFCIWIGTNACFALHNYNIGEWQQSILFAAYWILSLQGFFNFRRIERKR